MQDEQALMNGRDDNAISSHIQELIESLKDVWCYPHEPSLMMLERITTLVIRCQEPYRTMGLASIAQHLVNNMSLHFLDLVGAFQQNAVGEGISAEEREETLNDSMTEFYPRMINLSHSISVQSIEDLVTLSNITISLYGLSRADSAEKAQRWLYKLPELYTKQLTQEHLVTNTQTHIAVTVRSSSSTAYPLQLNVTVLQPSKPLTGQTHLNISIGSKTTSVVDTAQPTSTTALVA